MTIRWSVAIGVPILLSICWLSSDSLVLAESSLIVHIKNGTLEGTTMKSRNGREFVVFRGIPYAQPPIGKLRFESPKPSGSWSGVRSAKEEAGFCTQRNVFLLQTEVVGVEDCLYLNVYIRKMPSNDIAHRTKYPVIVYFHGGGFITGAGNSIFYGPQYFFDHDIVMVSPNYRLGPLGFLSTEDTAAPGNQGLKDQVQSLRWIQENIAVFGGDPDRVTIFGGSAGGASVHFHMISPLSRGLFHRAISFSGTALSPWAISPKLGHANSQAKRLGKLMNCPTDNSKELIECLRTTNVTDIIKTDYSFQVFGYCPLIPFRAVVEPDYPGAFLREEPIESLKSGNVAEVPWITGINSHEGAMKAASIFGIKNKNYDKLYDENFMELAPISLLYEPVCSEELRDNVTKSIREFYFGNKKIDYSMKWKVVDLYTDRFFFITTDTAVRYHLEALSSPVYFYFFAYRGSFSFSGVFGDPVNDYGVCHADEFLYLFAGSEAGRKETLYNEDSKMIDLMTNLIVNFAKTGTPTPEKTSIIPLKWKPVRTSKLEYLHIGNSTNIHMDDNLFSDRVKFWASLPHFGNAKIRQDLQRVRDEL